MKDLAEWATSQKRLNKFVIHLEFPEQGNDNAKQPFYRAVYNLNL